jgi:hypothetical protein
VSSIGLFQFRLFTPGCNDEGFKIQFNALRHEEILRACDPVELTVGENARCLAILLGVRQELTAKNLFGSSGARSVILSRSALSRHYRQLRVRLIAKARGAPAAAPMTP